MGMVWRVLFILLALSLASCGMSQKKAQQRQRAVLHMQIADSLLANGKLPEALAELNMAEQLAPRDAVIQSKIGLVFQLREKPEEAEKRFRKALDLSPNFTDVHAQLARLYIDTNRLGKALSEVGYLESDMTYPFPEKSLQLKGMIYFKQEKFKEAEPLLERSYQAQRTNCITSYFLGRTYYAQKKLKESAQVLDQAVKNCESAKFEEPLFYSAMAYYEQGQKLQAKARAEELVLKYNKSPLAKKAEGLLNILDEL